MKKLLVMAMAICGLSLSASAQTYIWKNNSIILGFPDSTPDSVTFNKSGKTNTAVAVDLGLTSGTKWADRNIGANRIWEYGDFFRWGEVVPFENKADSRDPYTKAILDANDDAATVNWGEEWCMPTIAQMEELLSECTWAWCIGRLNAAMGVVVEYGGYLVTGPNGNSIILPAAGCRGYDYVNDEYSNYGNAGGCFGGYWTSSSYENEKKAWYLNFVGRDCWNQGLGTATVGFSAGFSVRPVAKQ